MTRVTNTPVDLRRRHAASVGVSYERAASCEDGKNVDANKIKQFRILALRRLERHRGGK